MKHMDGAEQEWLLLTLCLVNTVQAQLAATSPKPGTSAASGESSGAKSSSEGDTVDAASAEDRAVLPDDVPHSQRNDSPPGSPEALVLGAFHNSESPIRGLLESGGRDAAPARLEEQQPSARTPETAAEHAAAVLLEAPFRAPRRRSGGWTPRGSGSSSGGGDAACSISLAKPAAGRGRKSAASSSSSCSGRSLGRELQRFACGGTPELPTPDARPVSPAGALSEGAGSNALGPAASEGVAASVGLVDVVYDLRGGPRAGVASEAADDAIADDASSVAASSSHNPRGWAATTAAAPGREAKADTNFADPLEHAAAARSCSSGSQGSVESLTLMQFAGRCRAQPWGGSRPLFAAAGVSAVGGLLFVGFVLAAWRRRAIFAGLGFLLRMFGLYRNTLRRLQ